MTLLIIIGAIIVNALVGAGVLAALDTKDQVFYSWIKEDPAAGLFAFFVLELWPIMAAYIIWYRINVDD